MLEEARRGTLELSTFKVLLLCMADVDQAAQSGTCGERLFSLACALAIFLFSDVEANEGFNSLATRSTICSLSTSDTFCVVGSARSSFCIARARQSQDPSLSQHCHSLSLAALTFMVSISTNTVLCRAGHAMTERSWSLLAPPMRNVSCWRNEYSTMVTIADHCSW
jgi:hypothetical protein